MNLFLSGGGNKEESETIDKEFVNRLDIEKPMLYIPIAMKGGIPYEDCYKWATSVFEPLGISDITMWTGLNGRSQDDLQQFLAIYIGGGNTFNLLHDLRKTNFDKLLMNFITKGGAVYGGSAGAIILGTDIMTCAHMDPNEPGLVDTQGLGRVGPYSIWCHYEEENDRLIDSFIKEYRQPIIALPEATGVFVSDAFVKVIGKSSAYRFDGKTKKSVRPGESFSY
ncbi:Type 1 glutamine amidotransferase-like domain-containing protein [Virgibacillus kekensis]|uniref:Type 1 glutamine amidotransferase-like domain-containing protein n=1 Tax=Virgibacillus kekensis TaxID=202261 RepID=A0ABV9DPN4_9BACI